MNNTRQGYLSIFQILGASVHKFLKQNKYAFKNNI